MKRPAWLDPWLELTFSKMTSPSTSQPNSELDHLGNKQKKHHDLYQTPPVLLWSLYNIPHPRTNELFSPFPTFLTLGRGNDQSTMKATLLEFFVFLS